MGIANLAILLLCVVLTSAAQVVLKIGTSSPAIAAAAPDMDSIQRYVVLLTSPMVMLGLALYVAAAIVWLRVLSVLDLSQAYPFVALSYAVTMAAGIFWLGEQVHATRVLGAGIILLGVVLISWR